jgi:hypothetical protein
MLCWLMIASLTGRSPAYGSSSKLRTQLLLSSKQTLLAEGKAGMQHPMFLTVRGQIGDDDLGQRKAKIMGCSNNRKKAGD